MKNIFTKPMMELNYIEAFAAAIISAGVMLGGIAVVAGIHEIVTNPTKVETCTKEVTEDVKEDED